MLISACVSFENTRVSKSALEKSNWLKNLKTIIEGTSMIVTTIHSKRHTLIHCRYCVLTSDGWDRTAQLSSLAQVCLDPFYRTIEGFCVLLDKEWISFGHKFKDRCGHLCRQPKPEEPKSPWQKNMFGAASKLFSSTFANSPTNSQSSESLAPDNISPREISPVFLQFLDCMYQVWILYPTFFEFDENLLIFLFHSSYSCQFGNFLFNNQHESKTFRYNDKSIQECTLSVWQYIHLHKHTFINPIYQPNTETIIPNTANLIYWSKAYHISNTFEEEIVEKDNKELNVRESVVPYKKRDSFTPTVDHLMDPRVPLIKSETNPFIDLQANFSKHISVSPKKYGFDDAIPKNASIPNSAQDGIVEMMDMVDLQEGVVANPSMSNPWKD